MNRSLVATTLLLASLPFVSLVAACGGDDDSAGSAGSAGTSAAGTGGSSAGSGGSSGSSTAGSGGGTAGSGGSAAGSGGASGAAGAKAAHTSMTCGEIAVLGPQTPDVSGACVSCVDAKCCKEATDCGNDAECKAGRECVAACNGASACAQKCLSDHMAGATKNDAFVACRQSSCNPDCQNLTCVGKVSWPAPAKTEYAVTFKLVDYQSGLPIPDLDVKVCKRSDAACAMPLQTLKTAADGVVMGTYPSAPSGVDVYLEIQGMNHVSLLYFPAQPSPSTFDGGSFNVNVFAKSTFQLVGSILGVTSDPTRGNVALSAEDCTGSRVAGATFSASTGDAMTQTFYVQGSLPSKAATETDGSGSGTIWNVPPGMVNLDAKLKGGTMLGASPVVVRAGFLTSTDLVPRP